MLIFERPLIIARVRYVVKRSTHIFTIQSFKDSVIKISIIKTLPEVNVTDSGKKLSLLYDLLDRDRCRSFNQQLLIAASAGQQLLIEASERWSAAKS